MFAKFDDGIPYDDNDENESSIYIGKSIARISITIDIYLLIK